MLSARTNLLHITWYMIYKNNNACYYFKTCCCSFWLPCAPAVQNNHAPFQLVWDIFQPSPSSPFPFWQDAEHLSEEEVWLLLTVLHQPQCSPSLAPPKHCWSLMGLVPSCPQLVWYQLSSIYFNSTGSASFSPKIVEKIHGFCPIWSRSPGNLVPVPMSPFWPRQCWYLVPFLHLSCKGTSVLGTVSWLGGLSVGREKSYQEKYELTTITLQTELTFFPASRRILTCLSGTKEWWF